jgi:hypothetical protein
LAQSVPLRGRSGIGVCDQVDGGAFNPEAMSASQEWTSRRRQAITEDGTRLLTLIQKLAETSAHLVAPHDLVLRILKLRWMGMENEAERMETTLHHLDPQSTLVREPADTD